MHKALYREYRPLTFEDVVGQDYIIKTLKNQIKEGSLSHAYLFCGTRGTGKTSTAKILSRAVNCTTEGEIKPCNECETCRGILDGSNLDVIEIDAASNNSVDDIRELRERVKYTPSNSKYKVYIIDEVHMLTQGAFNALLKTLEEPPPFVIFILATTEPNKIPATILSRCQRFDFKRVDIKTLMDRMRDICEREKVSIDEDALMIVARNGQGSVRDSLSILDKCVSFGSDRLTAKDVLDLLGSADPEQLFNFAESILESRVCDSIKLIDDYFMWGKDLTVLVSDVTMFFRSLMMAKVFNSTDDIIDFSREDAEKLMKMSETVDMEEIIRILSALSELANNIKYSTNPKMTFEIYIMKLSSPATDSSSESIIARVEKIEKLVEDGKISITNTPQIMYVSPDQVPNGANISHLTANPNELYGQTSEVIYNQNPSTSMPVSNDMDVDQEEGLKSEYSNMESKFESDPEIEIIKERWPLLLKEIEKEKKKTPLKVFLTYIVDLKYKDNVLLIVIDEGYTFAIPRLKKEDNYMYIKNAMCRVFGINLEPKFVLPNEIDEEIERTTEQTPAEKMLKNKLGNLLEVEDE